jgi:vacuolar-type H+-ATPase subunit C/Vma6
MAEKVSGLDYAFAVGKIRALERFLIKQEVFEEATKSGLPEALRLFVESDLYSDELLGVKDSQGLEEALNAELLKLKELVGELILENDLQGLLEVVDTARLGRALLKCKNRFLKDYLMYLADMHNIKTFLRLRILGEAQDELERHLFFEGFIKREEFIRAYALELAVFLNRLEYVNNGERTVDYAYFLRGPIEGLKKEKSFVGLEKAIADFLITALLPAKYLIFGPEPPLAYYFAKLNEINLIRMIVLSKLNNLPADLAQKRLNAVYA